jgi:RNA polymerase sigma-70 factor (ECF subfamily)
MMNDTELVKQILAGNNNAFRHLVSKHQRLVMHIAGRIIERQEDLEDICQEVFLKVFRKLNHFRGESRLSTWIAAIAYKTSISHLKNRSEKEMLTYDDHLKRKLEDKFETNEKFGIEREELKNYMLKMIEKLPVHYRTVITLYHLEEFSYREIENITGMPEGTVKSYLSRARELLKQNFERFNLLEKNNIFAVYE